MINILYEDASIIVVWKPVGMESQSSRGFAADMVSEIQKHIHSTSTGTCGKASDIHSRPANIHNKSTKPAPPYVGVIHRLDKPVSGVMVYAKDKNAAAALSRQVQDHKIQKKYLAVLCGKPVDNVENYVDYLLKDEKANVSRIVDKAVEGAKRAELSVRVLECETEVERELTLVEVTLKTGRHHQIRVQMAGHGTPIWGDNRYNPAFGGTGAVRPQRGDVALAAYQLSFAHPVTGKQMTFTKVPDGVIFRRFQWIRAKREENPVKS